MQLLDLAHERLSSFIEVIGNLGSLEFPYVDARRALESLDREFRSDRELLASLRENPTTSAVRQRCRLTLTRVDEYLPLLGFIDRSTSVRNPLECHGPLRRLARKLLGERGEDSLRLLLSSEWDHSPHVLTGMKRLKGFAFIGLPATESCNVLLIPLAAHEFGHVLWAERSVGDALGPKLAIELIGTLDRGSVAGGAAFLVQLAKFQLEETFCDAIGVLVFGESYAKAFVSLLAPGVSKPRNLKYPQFTDRMRRMEGAARAFGVPFSRSYVEMFDSLADPDGVKQDVIAKLDTAVGELVDHVHELAAGLVVESELQSSQETEIARIRAHLDLGMPAEGVLSLGDLLSAAWLAAEDDTLWPGREHMTQGDKRAALNELVLKNFELIEYEYRQEMM